jgi:transposase-like protein
VQLRLLRAKERKRVYKESTQKVARDFGVSVGAVTKWKRNKESI